MERGQAVPPMVLGKIRKRKKEKPCEGGSNITLLINKEADAQTAAGFPLAVRLQNRRARLSVSLVEPRSRHAPTSPQTLP